MRYSKFSLSECASRHSRRATSSGRLELIPSSSLPTLCGNISGEGQELLEDKEIWGNETALHGAIYEFRKRERSNEDGLFMPYQKGPITSTFTADWFLREGHTFPTNAWIHRITKGKESDRCDLCRALWIAEGRFRTEKEFPEQTLGHIQHTCEALSAAHIDTHHQCW